MKVHNLPFRCPEILLPPPVSVNLFCIFTFPMPRKTSVSTFTKYVAYLPFQYSEKLRASNFAPLIRSALVTRLNLLKNAILNTKACNSNHVEADICIRQVQCDLCLFSIWSLSFGSLYHFSFIYLVRCICLWS